jgi:hypothetical protein
LSPSRSIVRRTSHGSCAWGFSGLAKEYLYQRNGYGGGISGYRFELNAILPDTSRIEYIERKLEENGVRGKVIPPDERLAELAGEKYRALSAGWVAKIIEDLISSEELGKEIADQFLDEFKLEEARRHIEARFDKDRSLSWRTALEKSLEEVQEKHADAFKGAVEQKLRERLGRQAGGTA